MWTWCFSVCSLYCPDKCLQQNATTDIIGIDFYTSVKESKSYPRIEDTLHLSTTFETAIFFLRKMLEVFFMGFRELVLFNYNVVLQA
jgi:hypothetical protein